MHRKENCAGKASEGTQKEAGEWVSSQSRAKTVQLVGLTLKAGMLSNSQKGGKKDGRGERRREGGRVKRRNESKRGYVPHSEKLFWF